MSASSVSPSKYWLQTGCYSFWSSPCPRGSCVKAKACLLPCGTATLELDFLQYFCHSNRKLIIRIAWLTFRKFLSLYFVFWVSASYLRIKFNHWFKNYTIKVINYFYIICLICGTKNILDFLQNMYLSLPAKYASTYVL